MCGIAGLFRLEGETTPADRVAVERMTAAQRHRGPDDRGLFQDERVVLGHRRLSIIDLSECGRQPMTNEDGSVWTIFNGEIYNYRELAADLSQHQFTSRSDTEVLLHGYEEWGIEQLLGKLRGMFSFVIYDRRTSPSRCLLARDRLGIKPLYYFPQQESIVFASEVKPLVAAGLVENLPNPRALAGLLLLGSVPAPETSVRGVRCLLPGHYLTACRNGVTTQRYWDPASHSGAGQLAGCLQDAVQNHLVGDVPMGVFLSGGVDSAAVVALASRAQTSLTTLTVAFDEHQFDESSQARRIASRFQTRHHEVRVTRRDFVEELPKLLRAMDQPTHDGVNTYFVSRAARQAGLTVVLSGLGADEVFSGYRHHHWLTRHQTAIQRFAAVPGFVRRASVTAAAGYGHLRGRENWMRLASLANGVTDAGLYLALRGFFAPAQVRALLDAGEAEVNRAADEYLTDCRPASANGHATPSMFRYLEMRRYLHDQLLRDTDVFSMAHSVEVRVPYLDHALVERAAALQGTTDSPTAGNKPLLTEAVAEPAVSEAARRPKRGFTFPFASWMRQSSGDLRELALAGGSLNRRAVARLWNEFDRGRLHWSRAWMLAVLGAKSHDC
jgi:asparagine synthase (glutamine-hydrolysing)